MHYYVNCIGRVCVLVVQHTSPRSDVTYAWDDDAAQLGRFRGVDVLKVGSAHWVSDQEFTHSCDS